MPEEHYQLMYDQVKREFVNDIFQENHFPPLPYRDTANKSFEKNLWRSWESQIDSYVSTHPSLCCFWSIFSFGVDSLLDKNRRKPMLQCWLVGPSIDFSWNLASYQLSGAATLFTAGDPNGDDLPRSARAPVSFHPANLHRLSQTTNVVERYAFF